MTPYYADDWLTVYHGDAAAVLSELPAESVHCVVTSPPYWGLRDYGTATWIGGDEACDHAMPVSYQSSTLGASTGGRSVETHARSIEAQASPYRKVCRKCGAIREDGQLGLEPTPEAYVAALVAVFREVRRVLRSDGTVWLNLGDSYASSGTGDATGLHRLRDRPSEARPNTSFKDTQKGAAATLGRAPTTSGLKPKDLVGIPWLVAFALRADGWYLRSDIIWAKPNPMPESVTDRPTKSHEYLFLLSKSACYYFDADAVREADAGTDHARAVLTGPSLEPSGGLAGPHTGIRTIEGRNGSGRNLRSVWTIATAPYPGAHFATFPPKLVEPCIKAGCPEGGTVLDPFAGSGTTGLVAQRLSRRAVLIDLSMDYLGQLMDRNRDIPLGLGA